MLVKYVNYPEDKKGTVSETIYECKGCHFSEEPGDPLCARMEMFSELIDGKEQVLGFDKRHTHIYVMNDKGKTVDHYSWKYDAENNRCIRC